MERVLATWGQPMTKPFVSISTDGGSEVEVKVWRDFGPPATTRLTRDELRAVVMATISAMSLPADAVPIA